MPPSAISRPAPGLVGLMVLADQPCWAQPWPSTMSEDESVVHRPANRHANRSRNEVGMMSDDGRWVAATTMMPTARPRATRSRSSAENSSWSCFLPTVAEK